MQDTPLGRSRLPQDSTSPALRNSQPLLDVSYGLAPPCRAQKFPEATSFRIALSNAWSATSLFSRAFSFSSSFRRFA